MRQPLTPLGIWRVPRLGSANNLAMTLLEAAWIPMWYFLSPYLEQVLGYRAFASGAALLPMTGLLMVFMTAITARLPARPGAKPLIGSALGLAALTALATSQGAGKLGDLPALTSGFSAAFGAVAAIVAAGGLITLLVMRTDRTATTADAEQAGEHSTPGEKAGI